MPESGQSQERNKALAEAIRAGIAGGYEERFTKAPARAKAARQRAEEALASFVGGLEQCGYPPQELQDDLAEHRDGLIRVLSWGAFDYVVEQQDGTIEMITSEALKVPLAFCLHLRGNFADTLQEIEENIITMHLLRRESDQEPITNPHEDFANDFADLMVISLDENSQ